MQEEDDILAELTARFPYLQGKMRMQRARRLYVEVPADKFMEVFLHLHKNMKFIMLTTITGQDLGANLAAMYHLARTSGVLLNLLVAVPRENPVLQSITSYFPAADAYERELIDLLGMKVEGLPPGSRYPLPDGWPEGQYPLRKDWSEEKMNATVAASAAAQLSPNPAKESKP